jgi:hypothetical protein
LRYGKSSSREMATIREETNYSIVKRNQALIAEKK